MVGGMVSGVATIGEKMLLFPRSCRDDFVPAVHLCLTVSRK